MRYVIIGMSAAAISAARAIRSLDRGGQLTLVSSEGHPPYARIFITNYLAGKTSLEGMFIGGRSLDRELGATFLTAKTVVGADAAARRVYLASGEALSYDHLLVASGARPVLPDFPGSSLAGVTGMRTLADAQALSALLATAAGRGGGHPPHVVVLGGGLVSLKTAEALVRRGAAVTVVVASGQVLSQMADAATADLVQERAGAAGVRFIMGEDVVAASGDEEHGLTAVELRGGLGLRCDALVVGKGVVPNVEFLQEAGVAVQRGIIVDRRGRANVEEVWAAGDVAEGPDALTGRPAVMAMWPNAVRQGRAAGLDMAGAVPENEGGVRVNIGSFFGLNVASVGSVRAPEGAEEITVGPGHGYYRKVILKDHVVIGAILTGDVTGAGVWQYLAARHVSVDGFRTRLRSRSFTYQDVIPHPSLEPPV